MATSQNGWTANDRSNIVKMYIPGTGRYITVRGGDVANVFADFTGWFHTNIEDTESGTYDDWGYAERNIRGATNLSNHASGTAIDVNATKHPLGVRGTFTDEQTSLIRERLKRYKGAIRWGGDYSGRPDEMHFEINCSESELADIVKSLKPPVEDVDWTKPHQDRFPASRPLQNGDGPYLAIKQIQQRLQYFGYPVNRRDGVFDDNVENSVRAFQKNNSKPNTGKVDADTWKSIFSTNAVHYNSPPPVEEKLIWGKPFPGVVLRRGSRGPAVVAYQEIMDNRGWYIVVDGHFGGRTEEMTKQFQSGKGLEVTGVVDEETYNEARHSPND